MRKDFKNDSWDTFQDAAKSKKIILFGASGMGKSLANDLKKYNSSWNVIGFTDNKKEKWGTVFAGYPVMPPEDIKKYPLDSVIVLITSVYAGSIGQQLHDMGITEFYALTWLNDEMKDFYFQENIDDEVIVKLKNLMSDEESKEIIGKIVEKRKSGFMDYTDIKYWGEEYFIDSIFTPEEKEVFIDGGGYDGDTIEEFVKWTKGKYKSIYTFEPDTKMLGKMKENLYKYGDRVKLFEAGLSDNNTGAYMKETDGRYSGKVTEESEATNKIETVALDMLIEEPVTFIKMDIEGSELKALEGAKNIIKRDRPKLAICIYHKLNDLWEIPFWIHDLVPEYEFYVKHHGKRCYSTVLYAVVKSK